MPVYSLKELKPIFPKITQNEVDDLNHNLICYISKVTKNYEDLANIKLTKIDPIEYVEICEKAIQTNPEALEYVSADFLNTSAYTLFSYKDLCKLAIQKKGSVIKHVKFSNKPYDVNYTTQVVYAEFVDLAFAQDPYSLIDVDYKLLFDDASTRNMWKTLINKDKSMLEFIPRGLLKTMIEDYRSDQEKDKINQYAYNYGGSEYKYLGELNDNKPIIYKPISDTNDTLKFTNEYPPGFTPEPKDPCKCRIRDCPDVSVPKPEHHSKKYDDMEYYTTGLSQVKVDYMPNKSVLNPLFHSVLLPGMPDTDVSHLFPKTDATIRLADGSILTAYLNEHFNNEQEITNARSAFRDAVAKTVLGDATNLV